MSKENEINEIRSKQRANIAKRTATAGVLIPVGLILSYINPFAYIPIFGSKVNPFAHVINSISGVLVGLSFSIITALAIASLRFTLTIGSIHAFHGGISGAIIVGWVAHILRKKAEKYTEYAAFLEPIGTVFIGGSIAFLINPLGTVITGLFTWWGLFAASCIPGSIMGFLTIKILERAEITWKDFF
ncbi:MAG: ThiW protein [Promethearchaeota archaeon]|nr:MAG: ThiW protein [Candidatus Lokiarchaeota archaeon]